MSTGRGGDQLFVLKGLVQHVDDVIYHQDDLASKPEMYPDYYSKQGI